MSSVKSRNFRRRGADDDEDEENKATNGIAAPAAGGRAQSKPTASKPKRPSTQAPKNLLSFADEEESDAPISRPSSKPSPSSSRFAKPSPSSSAAHKLIASRERIPPSSSSLPSNHQPQAGTYTKEALLELQKNTKTLASSRPPPSLDPKPASEPVIVLKGLVKPKIDTETISGTVQRGEESEESEDETEKGMFMRQKDDALSRIGSMGLGKGKTSSGSLIPDQATIEAIRAKRERLRQSRAAASDYIALDGGSNHGEAEGLSDEEPEFQGRIGFIGDKVDNGKKGVFEAVDVREMDIGVLKDGGINDDGDEEDEEDKLWEEEQYRKGLGKRVDDGYGRGISSSVPVIQPQKVMKYPSMANAYSSLPSVAAADHAPAAAINIGGVAGSLDAMSISQQAELATKALHENLRRIRESHGRTMVALSKTDENLAASLLNVTTLENSLSTAGEKFIFMQKLRDFVSVICDFLQHKAPFIEELEDQMQKLHEERATAVLERRAADNDDEMTELEAAVSAARAVLSKAGGGNLSIEVAATAAQAATAARRESRNVEVELDEFGRDVNLQKRMDTARRAEARKRKRARLDLKRMMSLENDSSYQRVEGESSTDESDSESGAYKSNRDQLLQVAEHIFGDAADEYSKLSVVVERFERWKRDYSSSYNDAYMALSIPTILSPYVRVELLKWDPLHEDVDFINMKWHSVLFDYGVPEDESKVSPDDPDADLIPQLVEQLAIPILHHQIASCWDMLSTRETKLAVSATNLIVRYVPFSSTALGDLLSLLRNRLAQAVADLKVPTWDALVLKAVPNAARVAAYRFGMSVRLMRNICLWNEILAMPVLEKFALDDLLVGKIIPHLRSIKLNIHDAVTRSERVIASLSGVWSGASVKSKHSPKLQPLVEYLLMLGRALEKKQISGGMETESGGLARRLKKMLVELNEYDHARSISRTFNLREAL